MRNFTPCKAQRAKYCAVLCPWKTTGKDSENMKIKILNLIIAALCCLYWNVQAMAIDITHGPYLQNVGTDEATVVFLTDSTAVAWVEIAPDDGTEFYAQQRPRFYDTRIGIKSEARIHTVKITGLKPGTTYRYRIYAQEVLSHQGWRVHYGDIAAAAAYQTRLPSFTTLDESKQQTSFLIVNDIHQDNAKLKRLATLGEWQKRDLVFFNGDMLSIFDDEDQFFTCFMDTAVAMFAKEKPLYYVRGNHETRGVWASHFQDYVCPRESHLYFTFRQGPVFFICLDSGEDKPDSDLEYSGITDYDNYRSEQAEWLKGVIASDDFKQAKYHVVVCHIPPFDNGGPDWHGNIEVREKFVSVLNQADIDIMFCGHTHRYGFQAKSSGFNFPILINSNTGVVTVNADNNGLHVKCIEQDGKVNFEETIR